MKIIIKTLLILSIFSLNNSIFAQISSNYANKIVNSIYKIENSVKYPYGIKSLPIKGNTQSEREAYARKICLNTVRNTYVRWEKSGKTNDFIEFLGNRFCPIGAPDDPKGLNKNWIKNMNYYLKKENIKIH